MSVTVPTSAPVPVPVPPSPFNAIDELVTAGSTLFRIHSTTFRPAQFNPGFGDPTRFAFFGNPAVPILYAGDTEDTAFCEAILRETPSPGGRLRRKLYAGRQCSLIVPQRDLRLASLVGLGPRRFGIHASSIVNTDASEYAHTVKWAEAAHAAGFDGLAYPSRQAAGRRATVYFGDRVTEADFVPVLSYQWLMDDPAGFAKMDYICEGVGVTVLPF